MNRRLFARVRTDCRHACAAMAPAAFAQAPAGRGGGAPTPQYVSPEVLGGSPRHVPHLCAEGAGHPARGRRHSGRRTDHAADQGRERRLGGHGRPDRSGRLSLQLQRRRRRDDRSAQPATSESNNNVWSLFYVPGSDFMDTKNVPHGAVAAVTYYSTALDDVPPHARLHAAGLRDEQRQVSGLLSAARRRRQRRLRGRRSAAPASSSTT